MSEQDMITNSMLKVVRDLIFKAKVGTMFIDVSKAEITVPEVLNDWQIRRIDKFLKRKKGCVGYYFETNEGLIILFKEEEEGDEQE